MYKLIHTDGACEQYVGIVEKDIAYIQRKVIGLQEKEDENISIEVNSHFITAFMSMYTSGLLPSFCKIHFAALDNLSGGVFLSFSRVCAHLFFSGQ